MNDQTQTTPRLFAVVELFGHQRIAGEISEQTFGGAAFIRVDVPLVEVGTRTIQPHTRSFGASAIYAVSWCDEITAKLAAQDICHEPLRQYSTKDAIDALSEKDRHALLTGERRQPRLGFDEDPDEDPDRPF